MDILAASWAILRLSELCAATTFGRQIPFSQAVCATWKDNQLHCLCCPTPRYSSEVSACEWTLPLRPHETIGTSVLLTRAPTFPAFRQMEPYARFQHARCSNGASRSVFQCRPASCFESRNSFKRFPINMMVSLTRMLPQNRSRCSPGRGHFDMQTYRRLFPRTGPPEALGYNRAHGKRAARAAMQQ